MKGIKRRMLALMLALAMLAAEAVMVSAAELPEASTYQDEGIALSNTNPATGFSYGIVQPPKTRSTVVGEGLRLRSGPSTSYPVIEIMDYGDTVVIDWSTSSQVSGWYFVKRLATGTWGWASSDYILVC